MELAAIGRRVCESEWDLFTLLGVAPGEPGPEPVAKGNPVGALREADGGRARRGGARVPRIGGDGTQRGRGALRGTGGAQASAIVERELVYGREVAVAHTYRLRDARDHVRRPPPAAAIRAGDFDDGWEPVAAALAVSARDRRLVANPSYLPAASA